LRRNVRNFVNVIVKHILRMSSLVMRVLTLTSRDTNDPIVSLKASFKEKEMDLNDQTIFLINPFQSKTF
jgi:hypothetical protein